MLKIKMVPFIFLLSLLLSGVGFSEEPSKERGDQLLKQMSARLASAKTLTFSTSEVHESVGLSGQKRELRFSREVALRRPDRLWYKFQGEDADALFYYDGKLLTAVLNGQKAYAQGPVPATIDETIDYVATYYDVPMPMADIIESSPYDSLMTSDTKGGYLGEEMIEGASCQHLSYQQEVVDWQIWIHSEGDPLPCKLVISYKQETAQPTSTMIFKNWNLAADVKEDTFAYKIPEGYERIAMLKKVIPKEAQTQSSQDEENQQ